LCTPRWLLLHATALLLVVAFLALGYWQLNRAADGNLLSFGYALEWPAFAAFVVFVWIKEMRRVLSGDRTPPPERDRPEVPPEPSPRPVRLQPARTGAAYDDSDDEELASYNRYLAWRNAHPNASLAEYPY